MEKRKKEKIKLAITFAVIVIAFGIAITIMLKYNQEGETNMPFNLSDIVASLVFSRLAIYLDVIFLFFFSLIKFTNIIFHSL